MAAWQACVAALGRVTDFVDSSSGKLGAGAGQAQLAQLQSQLADAIGALPAQGSTFDRHSKALMEAVLAALHALADRRHAQDEEWVQLLAAVLAAWAAVDAACNAGYNAPSARETLAGVQMPPLLDWLQAQREWASLPGLHGARATLACWSPGVLPSVWLPSPGAAWCTF
jgi:hypothetical protein